MKFIMWQIGVVWLYISKVEDILVTFGNFHEATQIIA